MSDETEMKLEPVGMRGGKRANLGPGHLDDWWVGWGKDEFCQFEGPWEHMAILAAKILRHENTRKVAPNLFVVMPLTPAQEDSY
jgi:hypothetical protein